MSTIESIFEDLKIELARIEASSQNELARVENECKAAMAEIDARIAKLESEADPAEVARVKAIESRVNAVTLDELNAKIAESEKKPKQPELMFTCECGSKLQKANTKRHLLTKKHLQYAES